MTLNFKEECNICPEVKPKKFLRIFHPLWIFVMISLYVFSEIYLYQTDNEEEQKISYFGHLSALLSGFLAGILILHDQKTEKWEIFLKYATLLFYISAFLGLLITHIIGSEDIFPCKI